ncbi:hypothetical protein D9757_004529 [Collybiopsis confluens]|uniref:Uncharacterized protein n=1 Tax=Collybiopsis confluens TaxID=2823264 RepID=A0A8H5HX90_9AGAR|nr:hypothetical protein D9757_004529 [Collybiopsis confluens]
MTWPSQIASRFKIVNPNTTDESEYFGPYNSLLHHLFPYLDGYQVNPQYKGPASAPISHPTTFVVTRFREKGEETPLLFIDVQARYVGRYPTTRSAVDAQMRNRFRMLGSLVEIPCLYGISAIGTRICIYKYSKEKNRLEPRPTPPSDDITTPEGEAAIRLLAEDVKEMSDALDI